MSNNTKVKPIPEGFGTLTPHLIIKDAAKANAVALTVGVKRNGEEIRLNAERVLPLEAARLNRAMGALKVRLAVGANPGEIAGVVRHLASLPDAERGDILVELPLDDGRVVTLKLPQTYTISLKAQRALKDVPGVERVEATQAA